MERDYLKTSDTPSVADAIGLVEQPCRNAKQHSF